MMCFCIGTYITHIHPDLKETKVHISPEQLREDGFAIEHESNLPPLVHELQHSHFLHPSDDDSSDTEANSENASIDPERPPFRTHVTGSPHMYKGLARKPISNECFNIFEDENAL
jgi:hypothetical protein